MNNLDEDYIDLLRDIYLYGNKKEDRTGTGTISLFGKEIRHNMKDGFPLLTTKKMAWKTMVYELLWFLRGDTNIRFLVENNCNIWNGDAFKNYEKVCNREIQLNEAVKYMDYYTQDLAGFIEMIKTNDRFAGEFGELGPIYGSQWRKWLGKIDQIKDLINDLKNNPDSRRLMVTAWNPGDLSKQILPPCHYGFQCYTRVLELDERINITLNNPNTDVLDFGVGNFPDIHYHTVCDLYETPRRALSLKWVQRSCDFPLGVPVNIASYGLLLMILAKEANMVPEELIGSFGDSHIYLNQIDGVKEQIERTGHPLPTVVLSDRKVNDVSEYTLDDIKLIDYISDPKINYPLSN